MNLARVMADYSTSVSYGDLSAGVVWEAKRRIIDSIGVSFAALDATPVKIARTMVDRTESMQGAALMGSKVGTPVEEAAFVNGCAVRYLDFDDIYLSKQAMHPSDNIPALMAVAETEGASYKDFIAGVVLAYGVACRLADASSIRDRGWDHVVYIVISSAVGAAHIMSLGVEQTMQAINLAVTSSIVLCQTRAVELFMWEGCTAVNAAKNGVFAASLVKHGMADPSPVFEGKMGFFEQVAGDFVILFEEKNHKIVETHLKSYPIEHHAMSAVDAVMKLKNQAVGQIESIIVGMFTVGWKIIARDPEKWNPQTKETANHSLPYTVDRAFLDGGIWLDSYDSIKIQDDRIKALLKTTKVNVDPHYDRLYPKAVPNRVQIRCGGTIIAEEVVCPRGHYMNPLTDGEANRKYSRLGRPSDALPMLRNMERRGISDVMQVLNKDE